MVQPAQDSPLSRGLHSNRVHHVLQTAGFLQQAVCESDEPGCLIIGTWAWVMIHRTIAVLIVHGTSGAGVTLPITFCRSVVVADVLIALCTAAAKMAMAMRAGLGLAPGELGPAQLPQQEPEMNCAIGSLASTPKPGLYVAQEHTGLSSLASWHTFPAPHSSGRNPLEHIYQNNLVSSERAMMVPEQRKESRRRRDPWLCSGPWP